MAQTMAIQLQTVKKVADRLDNSRLSRPLQTVKITAHSHNYCRPNLQKEQASGVAGLPIENAFYSSLKL